MTEENLVFIKGGAYNDIKKALRQWIDLYAKDLQVGLAFLLYKNGRGNHVIQVDKNLDNTRFFFLVNYLKYPENIDYNVEVEGFTLGKDDNIFKGEKLLVYISLTDTEGDNVFVTTAKNKHYKFDFGGKIVESREKKRYYTPPTDLKRINSEILEVKHNLKRQTERKKKKKLDEKRFKIIATIFGGLFFAGISIYQVSTFNIKEFSYFIGLGISGWYYIDYRILQSNKLYMFCLFVALIFLMFTILLNSGLFNKELLNFGGLYPLSFLLIQKPLRLFYIMIFKREPIIEKSESHLIDILYSVILFLGLALFPFILMHILTK